jgi:hypothetical protein
MGMHKSVRIRHKASPTNCALYGFSLYRQWSPFAKILFVKTDICEISDYEIGWSCSTNIDTKNKAYIVYIELNFFGLRGQGLPAVFISSSVLPSTDSRDSFEIQCIPGTLELFYY